MNREFIEAMRHLSLQKNLQQDPQKEDHQDVRAITEVQDVTEKADRQDVTAITEAQDAMATADRQDVTEKADHQDVMLLEVTDLAAREWRLSTRQAIRRTTRREA